MVYGKCSRIGYGGVYLELRERTKILTGNIE
jgi:hypothetical protein